VAILAALMVVLSMVPVIDGRSVDSAGGLVGGLIAMIVVLLVFSLVSNEDLIRTERGDEIGVAERELSDMQRDLVSMLHQKSRLAALGLAVSKINHDLRNLLASSQLLSDQLSSVPDPRVQRFAPKLMRSLERAIAFCQSTLSYGRAQEAAPDRRMMLVEPVVAEVRESAGLATDASITVDRRDRARAFHRCRPRPAVPRAAQPRAQRGAGAGKPPPQRRRRRSRSALPAAARARSSSGFWAAS